MPRNTIDKQLAAYKRATTSKPTLDDLLQEVVVHEPGSWENDAGPREWWAVSDEAGIRAYFGKEADAFAFRLFLVNLRLNAPGVLARAQ